MTDLVTPDHVAVTCSQTVISLYTSDCANSAVRQKARKVCLHAVAFRALCLLLERASWCVKMLYIKGNI